MVLSLSKKERALCLFNGEFLKGKVNEAKEVLTTLGGDLEEDKVEDHAGHPLMGGGGEKLKAPFAAPPQRTKSAPVDPTSPPMVEEQQQQHATASTPTSPAAVAMGLPLTEEEDGQETEEVGLKLKEVKEIASWGTKEIWEYLRENEESVGRGGLGDGVGKPEEGKRREMEMFLEG